jgi:hypothetical protein
VQSRRGHRPLDVLGVSGPDGLLSKGRLMPLLLALLVLLLVLLLLLYKHKLQSSTPA